MLLNDLRILRVSIDPGRMSAAGATLLDFATDRTAECSMTLLRSRPVFAATGYEADIVRAELAARNGYLHGLPPLPDRAVVLDIGAHIGMFSIEVLHHRPDARVIAVEPCAATHAALRKNLALHGAAGSAAIRAALGARAGVTEIVGFRGAGTLACAAAVQATRAADHQIVWRTRHALGRSLPRLLAKGSVPPRLASEVAVISLDCLFSPVAETVRCRTVSDLISQARIRRVALLKVDVEGSENLVLSGIRAEHWPLVDAVVAEADRVSLPRLAATLRGHGLIPQVTESGDQPGGFGRDCVVVRAGRVPAPGAAWPGAAGLPRATPAQAAGEVRALLAQASSLARRTWPDGHVLVDCYTESGPILLPWHAHGAGVALRHGAAWARHLLGCYPGAGSDAASPAVLSRIFGLDWTAMAPLLREYPAHLVVAARMAAEQLIDRAVRASGATRLPGGGQDSAGQDSVAQDNGEGA